MAKAVKKAIKKYVKKTKAFKMYKGISMFLGKPAYKKIQFDAPVYAVYTGGTNLINYGFTTLGANQLDMGKLLVTSTQFTNISDDFSFFQLYGVSLQYQRMHTESGSIPLGGVNLSVPPLAFVPDIVGGVPSVYSVYDYENALKVQQVNEDGKPQQKYFAFPVLQVAPTTSTTNPNMMLGKIWQCLPQGSILPARCWISMGYPATGVYSTNASAGGSYMCGNLKIVFYTRWAVPKIV